MEDVFSIQDPHFWALSRFVYVFFKFRRRYFIYVSDNDLAPVKELIGDPVHVF